MLWYLAATGLFLHVFFWGAGLAALVLPRRMARFWPALAPAAGLALQSAVVWFADWLSLRGTDQYAWPALLAPIVLAGVAWKLRGPRKWKHLRSWLRSWLGVAAAVTLAIWITASPLARGRVPLTSVSLGSCDAADYGAGARLLQEISPDEFGGFIGDRDNIRIGDVETFREYWRQLNHFTPAAAMAFNGSVLDLRAYQVVTLFTVALPALLAPGLFLVGRSLFRFGPAGALLFGFVASLSPLWSYAVYHNAPGQLLAAMAIALLTWTSVRAFEISRSWRGLLRWLAPAVLAIWLLAGSYNFMLLFAFAPAVAWVGWRAIGQRRLKDALRWSIWAAAAVAIVAAVFFERFIGLAQRFALFQQYDFGWQIPALRPDAWLGAVTAPALAPAQGGYLLGGGLLLVAAAVGFFWGGAWRRRPGLVLLTLAAPAIAGYAILIWKSGARPNASYDAYKLLSVFLPFVIGALCPWLAVSRRSGPGRVAFAIAAGYALLTVNVMAGAGFRRAIAQPPLIVDRDLAALERVEALPSIDSINMVVEEFWSRLWANAFLLRRRQYFPSDTYEMRWTRPLRGNYDLRETLVRVTGAGAAAPDFSAGRFVLRNRHETPPVAWRMGAGWFQQERHRTEIWRWSTERPAIFLENRQAEPLRVRFRCRLRAAEDQREVVLRVGEQEAWRGAVTLAPMEFESEIVALSPGEMKLEFDSPTPPTALAGGDPRRLLIALFCLEIEVIENAPPAAAEPVSGFP